MNSHVLFVVLALIASANGTALSTTAVDETSELDIDYGLTTVGDGKRLLRVSKITKTLDEERMERPPSHTIDYLRKLDHTSFLLALPDNLDNLVTNIKHQSAITSQFIEEYHLNIDNVLERIRYLIGTQYISFQVNRHTFYHALGDEYFSRWPLVQFDVPDISSNYREMFDRNAEYWNSKGIDSERVWKKVCWLHNHVKPKLDDWMIFDMAQGSELLEHDLKSSQRPSSSKHNIAH